MNRLGFYFYFIDKVLPLNIVNCKNRKVFAKTHIFENTDFKKATFTDEKRFNFDGPDNMVSYLHKDANTKIGSSRIKRQMGGGGVMVLGAISNTEKNAINDYRIKIYEQSLL